MKKSELTVVIAKAADISKAAAGKALNGTIEVISNALSKGERVTLIGFGNFFVTKRATRDGLNPQTGKPMRIKAKTAVKFKVGEGFAEAVK